MKKRKRLRFSRRLQIMSKPKTAFEKTKEYELTSASSFTLPAFLFTKERGWGRDFFCKRYQK